MKLLLALTITFGIALALVVGFRLEQASLAVVVGVICGIVASLPLGGALLYLLWRERQHQRQLEERPWRSPGQLANPPVIILNSGRGSDVLPGSLPMGPRAAESRDFVIVGEESETL